MQKNVLILLLTMLGLMVGVFGVSGETLRIPDACPDTNSWNGSVNDNWSLADNWDCGQVPRNTTAIIPAVNSRSEPIVNFPVVPESTPLVSLADLEVHKDASFNLNGRTLFLSGSLTNSGTLIDTQFIPDPGVFPPTAYFFAVGGYGGLELKRDMGSFLFDPSPVTVKIMGNQGCDDKNTTVHRCFDIEPTNKQNVSVDAIFYFAPSELPAGMTCEILQAFRWNGAEWQQAGLHGGNDCSSANYHVIAYDITQFSPFVLSPGSATAISTLELNAAAYNQGVVVILVTTFLLGLMTAALMRTRPDFLFKGRNILQEWSHRFKQD